MKGSHGFILAALILLLVQSNAVIALCDDTNTPKIRPYAAIDLFEDQPFKMSISLTRLSNDNVTFAIVPMDRRFTSMETDNNGIFSWTPTRATTGIIKAVIVAVKGSCSDSTVLEMRVWAKPVITSVSPGQDSLIVKQSETIDFRISASDIDPEDTLKYYWYKDSMLLDEFKDSKSMKLTVSHNITGSQNITVVVEDSYNLTRSQTWILQVSKQNRPPILLHEIPGFLLFKNTPSEAYNLNDYFSDPDGGRLIYGYRQVLPTYENFSYANITVNITNDGHVNLDPSNNTIGFSYVVFSAQDIFNLTAESNIVRIEAIPIEKIRDDHQNVTYHFCGDKFCDNDENCSTCPYDCGFCNDSKLKGCNPDWKCSEWSPCLPEGLQRRNCTDNSNCDNDRTKPLEIKFCFYNATCDDGFKNGIEVGVDCGGPCPPCPNCSDNIQNGLETGIDCGGICKICPSCNDSLLNQEESDIDCGGSCAQCPGNKSCNVNKDCESLRCEYMICTYPSCYDRIRNNNEESIDCGGPCEKTCGNCSDGIHNGAEEGVDCGGKCKPCPNCTDDMKNQGELFTDCGGPCRACTFTDLLNAYIILFIAGGLLIALFLLFIFAYFFFLLAKPEKAKRLYDNNSFFVLMTDLNKVFRPYRKLRGKPPVVSSELIARYRTSLSEISKNANIQNKDLHQLLTSIFTSFLSLPGGFDDNIFYMRARESRIPLFLKVLLVGFYKKTDVLLLNTFVSPEEKNELIIEFRFLLSELSKQ